MLVVIGPVLLLAWHRPLHPLPCPVSSVDVGGAAAAAVDSSVRISCSDARCLHGAARKLQVMKEDLSERRTQLLMHGR